MTATTTPNLLDLRRIPPRDRHPMIFSTFGKLAAGEALELVNDHDPRPLHTQFQDLLPGQFAWNYLESGPELWRIAIRKTTDAAPSVERACCGSCGCA